MKNISRFILAFSLTIASTTFAMDENGWATVPEILSAFDSKAPFGNRPGYVKPLVNNIGTILNSNWISSATVEKSLSIEYGIPIAIAPLGDDDRTYGNNSPTIFGDNNALNALNYDNTIGCNNQFPYDAIGCPVINGSEELNGLSAFTYPYLQLALSAFHVRIALRGMWLPAIENLRDFNLYGFSLQYSFGHFYQYLLPRIFQPLNISFMFGYTANAIGYRPDDYTGQLDMDFTSYTFGAVIGYKIFDLVEAMMTLGYQSSKMKSSGHLYQGNILFPDHEFTPDITVKGDNGFRIGFEVALQIGGYHPVVGYDNGNKSSFTTNIIYFKQTFGKDKSPAEIAKEEAEKKAKQTESAREKTDNMDKELKAETEEESEEESEDNSDEESEEEAEDNSSEESTESSEDNSESETSNEEESTEENSSEEEF